MKLIIKYIENKKKSENIDDDFSIKLKERKKRKIRKNSNCFGGKNYQKEKEIKIEFLGMNGVGKTDIISSICGKIINIKYEHTKKIIDRKINFNAWWKKEN